MARSAADEPALGGGYVTRGRALLLERELAAFEAKVWQRLDEFEARLDRISAMPLDLLRAQTAAMLEVFRSTKAETERAAAAAARANGTYPTE